MVHKARRLRGVLLTIHARGLGKTKSVLRVGSEIVQAGKLFTIVSMAALPVRLLRLKNPLHCLSESQRKHRVTLKRSRL
jgi:hypothetical protein